MTTFHPSRQCSSKIAFPSEKEARRFVGVQTGNRGHHVILEAYCCPHCDFWHRGNGLKNQREYKNMMAEEAAMVRRIALGDSDVDLTGDEDAAVETQHQTKPEN